MNQWLKTEQSKLIALCAKTVNMERSSLNKKSYATITCVVVGALYGARLCAVVLGIRSKSHALIEVLFGPLIDIYASVWASLCEYASLLPVWWEELYEEVRAVPHCACECERSVQWDCAHSPGRVWRKPTREGDSLDLCIDQLH